MKAKLKQATWMIVMIGLGVGLHAGYQAYGGRDLLEAFQIKPAREKASLSNMPPPSLPRPELAVKKVAAPRASTTAVEGLSLYPKIAVGGRTPLNLWAYYGRGASSFSSPTLPMRFEEWLDFHRAQKPGLMKDVREYMASRYDFTPAILPKAFMSGGKPIMAGPAARLPKDLASWEELADLTPAEIRERDVFPFKPLAHPLQSTAHMLFPDSWIAIHPEHTRIDVGFDIPEPFLPEFPPPMYLTTHKEMGDVTNGQEVTFENYYQIFDGLLTPEQMEGLKELLQPSPSLWFNQTDHRLTEEPSAGIACFDCHVNGHTNGAFDLAPDSRPNMARLRVDTPSLRGNYNLMQFSAKRSIRSLSHFAGVGEFFGGDPGMQQAIGSRGASQSALDGISEFNAILDYPPAPKLTPLGLLDPDLASKAELRGEQIFHGEGRCVQCHYGPAFVDDYMHDLQAERFYLGRPEGPIKTSPLRGIKDTPPYLHDGRLMTLDDAVEFFNLILQLQLSRQDKQDLRAYLLTL
jgi:cytochrome c peroxidase